MRLVTWPMLGLAALSLASTAPLTAAGLMGVGLLWIGRRRLLGVALAGAHRSHRGGSVTTPGDPPASGVLRHRLVTLARDWWLELAVASSVWWLPLPAAGVVASFCLLGVFGLAARTEAAQTLATRNVALEALVGGAAAVADVFERQRIRRGWRRGTVGCGMPTPRIRSLSRMGAGWSIRFATAGAWSAEHYERALPSLASALHAREVRLERDAADAARGTAHVLTGDLLAAELGAPSWAGRNASLWDAFAVGVDERGEPLEIAQMPYETLLVGGVKGSGKSAFLHLLIARAAADPNCTLWIADGKGLDFSPWEPRCRRFVKGGDPDEMRALLADVSAWMDQRRGELEAIGREKALPGDPTGLLVVDETTVWDLHTRSEPMRRHLMHAVQRGRAHGLGVVVATQRPDAGSDGALPGLIRDNLDLKVAFRTSRPGTSDTILGQGSADDGVDASKLPKRPGIGIADVDGNPRVFRAYRLTPAQLEPMGSPAGPVISALEPMGSTPQPAPMAEDRAPEQLEPMAPYPTDGKGSPVGSSMDSPVPEQLGHGHTAGGKRSPTYRTWRAMRNRCRNRNADQWPAYGGRGIRICLAWDDFATFALDLGERPEGTSLDRIDPDGHYSCGKCPDCAANGWAANCRWASATEQRRNQRRNQSNPPADDAGNPRRESHE